MTSEYPCGHLRLQALGESPRFGRLSHDTSLILHSLRVADLGVAADGAGVRLLVLLLVVTLMFMSQFASLTNQTYLKLAHMTYPDVVADFGAFLFGLSLTWALLPPSNGRAKFSERLSSEKWLFLVGLVVFFVLTAVVVLSFAFGEEPKLYWTDAQRAILFRTLRKPKE